MKGHASPHRLVMAAAGTGKTFQLTGVYMRHALREFDRQQAGGRADFSSILATTFTRKAAGEILDRVLDRLSAAIVDPRKLAELRAHIGVPLDAPRCTGLLACLLASLDRLSVVTIDAYFLRIASLFALELGVPAGWRIADDETDQDLREEAIDRVYEQGDRGDLLRLLEMLSRGDVKRSVRASVVEAVNAVYQAYLTGDGNQEVWRAIGPQTAQLAESALDKAVAAMEKVQLPKTKAGQPNKRWIAANEAAIVAVREAEWARFLGAGMAAKIVASGTGPAEFYGAEIDSSIVRSYAPLIDHAKAMVLTEFQNQNVAMCALAKRFDEVYRGLKAERGLYRFEDIPRMLLDGAMQDRLEEVYFRMDATIRDVLLDEFQDTSITQFRLIEPLLDEVLSADDGRAVFCVGDIKQSLYAWRGAEPGLMPAMPGRWGGLVTETLEKSFRSSKVITDTTNAVFADLLGNPALQDRQAVAKEWSKAFKEHSTALTIAGAARLVVAPVDDEQKPLVAAFAAARVKAILDAVPRATIGVLVRTNKHIPSLIYELRKLGIEASEEGGSPLLDSAPVAVAVSLLQLADFPDDTAAAYHVATSPLGAAIGLSTPVNRRQVRTVASYVRARLMSDGYAGVLRRVLQQCAPSMDARGLARFNQLIDLAQEFDGQAGTRPSEFVRLARERRVEDPSRTQVRVMSIHRAKGLEFDAVILPDLDRKWELNKNSFLVDRDDPFGPVTVATRYPGEEVRALHDGLNAVYHRSLDRVVSEELSCLYVAMTRAVHCLEMIVRPSEKPDLPMSAAGVLRAALAPSTPALPGEELWRFGLSQEWDVDAKKSEVSRPETPAQEAALVLKAGSGSFVPRLHRVSPSSLEKGVRGLGSVFSPRGERARSEGTLLHAWFELIQWLDDGVPSARELTDVAAKLGWDSESSAELRTEFVQLLSGDVAAVLSRAWYQGRPPVESIEVRREWAFEAQVPATVPGEETVELAGCFDRLVLGRNAGKVVWADIVDFKSDDVVRDDRESLRRSLDVYQPQIQAYARATREMFGLDFENVTASLAFVRAGVIARVDLAS